MTDEERDIKIAEMYTDIKWIKSWVTEWSKYKYMVWAALIGTLFTLLFK